MRVGGGTHPGCGAGPFVKVESVNSVPSALALLPQRRLPLAGVLLIAGLLSALLGILDGTRSLRLGALVLVADT